MVFEHVFFQVWSWHKLWLTQRRWAVKSFLTSWIDALSQRTSHLTAKTKDNVCCCCCVHRYTNIGTVPSSCQLTGSEETQQRPPEWRDLNSQPAVSNKASPPQGATASLPPWETLRSRGWVPHHPTERTTTELSQAVFRRGFSCQTIHKKIQNM